MISYKSVTVKYGSDTVLDNLCVDFPVGEITAVIGESGVGKTTLLNAAAGFCPYSGEIDGLPPRISYVFQEDRLIECATVRKNIELVTADRGRVDNFLELTELKDKENALITTLSGGQRQRVNIARAFAYGGELLLLDEPFRNLDLSLKMRLINMFKAAWLLEKPTVILVTHDIDEALLLASEVKILEKSGINFTMNNVPQESFLSINEEKKKKLLNRIVFSGKM